MGVRDASRGTGMHVGLREQEGTFNKVVSWKLHGGDSTEVEGWI